MHITSRFSLLDVDNLLVPLLSPRTLDVVDFIDRQAQGLLPNILTYQDQTGVDRFQSTIQSFNELINQQKARSSKGSSNT